LSEEGCMGRAKRVWSGKMAPFRDACCPFPVRRRVKLSRALEARHRLSTALIVASYGFDG
jgi:hypothetical protein